MEASSPSLLALPPKDGPVHLSWSQVSTLAGCGRQYELKYRTDAVDERGKGYFIGGRALHATIEEAEATGWWGDPENFVDGGDATVFFHACLYEELEPFLIHDDSGRFVKVEGVDWGGRKTKEFPQGEDWMWWMRQGPSMLRRYAAKRRADHAAGMPLPQTEVEVRILRPSGQPFVAYVDQLFPDRVRDYKTGGKFTPGTPLQLAFYEYLLREAGHEPRQLGEFIYLRANDGRLVYSVELDIWVTLVPLLIEQAEERLAWGSFEMAPGWQCGNCDVAQYCEVGRRLGA